MPLWCHRFQPSAAPSAGCGSTASEGLLLPRAVRRNSEDLVAGLGDLARAGAVGNNEPSAMSCLCMPYKSLQLAVIARHRRQSAFSIRSDATSARARTNDSSRQSERTASVTSRNFLPLHTRSRLQAGLDYMVSCLKRTVPIREFAHVPIAGDDAEAVKMARLLGSVRGASFDSWSLAS